MAPTPPNRPTQRTAFALSLPGSHRLDGPLRELEKYRATAAMAATALTDGSLYFLLGCLMRFLRVAVLLAVWRTILSARGAEAGMTLDEVLGYTLVAAVFADQLAVRTGVENLLWSGDIATRLLRPLNLVGQVVAQMAGRWLVGLVCISLPLLCAAPLLGVDPRPASAGAGLLFVPSLALGIAVGVAVDFGTAALMVAHGWSVWAVERLRAAVAALLSGAVVPLALLPWRLGDALEWLPFASMAWAPLSVYTGVAAGWEVARLLALQCAWALALAFAARRLWLANRQQVVIYGG